MDWAIFYKRNNFVHTSDDGPVSASPDVEVVCVVEAYNWLGRLVFRSAGFYLLRDDGWRALSIFGLLDQLIAAGQLARIDGEWFVDGATRATASVDLIVELLTLGNVKRGISVITSELERIVASAEAYPGFLPISATVKPGCGSYYQKPENKPLRTVFGETLR